MSWFIDLFVSEAKTAIDSRNSPPEVDESLIAKAVSNYMESNNVPVGSNIKIATVSLLAANWVGDNNKYSQVVSITGVTPYSQVDLTPSVDQLATFHNKDIAFVAENENGVVTVHVVGDKPANDYEMQVTIKEITV